MNHDTFLALVREGLWEDVNDNENQNENLFEGLDWGEVQKLAEEQSVVGLVAAGFDKLKVYGLPLTEKLTLLGKCQLMEQRNVAMNRLIESLVTKLQRAGIKVLLVKGQGIAQCYARPLWRSSGDVDLLLDGDNYKRAKEFFSPLASSVDEEDEDRMHLGLTIDSWLVELHGTLRQSLLKRINIGLDEIQNNMFDNNRVRVWKNAETEVLLPSADNDVIMIFAHILQHYFGSGVGLRQICDWCRLLWEYHDTIDAELLRERLLRMKIMTEWQVFCAYAIDYLGAPHEAMLLFDGKRKWVKKAQRMNKLIMRVGNFGQGRDNSYFQTRPYLIRKYISFKYRISDATTNFSIFPQDSLVTFYRTLSRGLTAAIQGKY